MYIILPVNVSSKHKKKEQAYYIAPLQPLTLAPVKAWGSSEGAGRIGLALNRLQKYYIFLN